MYFLKTRKGKFLDPSSIPGKPERIEKLPGETPVEKSRWHTYLLLHIIILMYSLAGICSKMAAGEQFASSHFFAWYGGVLAILFVYAIVWQQILKRLPLTTAFANKGVALIWGMIWGSLVFAEQIGIWMIIGATLVFAGIVLVVTSDE